jgi:hypothetical protein
MFPKVYFNIRSAINAGKPVCILSGCADTINNINIGSFEYNDSVERHSIVHYRHSYLKRQNISSSFKLDTLTCNSCTGTEHRVLHRESECFQARDLVPQAFVLADLYFPAALPVEGNVLKSCMGAIYCVNRVACRVAGYHQDLRRKCVLKIVKNSGAENPPLHSILNCPGGNRIFWNTFLKVKSTADLRKPELTKKDRRYKTISLRICV